MHRILIIAPSWIGDMIMAQTLVALLRQQQQDCHIDVLALPWIAPLLTRMPGVDGIIDMPVGHGKLGIGQRYHLGRSFRGRYDQAILLPNTLKSALIPLFAKIPKRTGFVGETRYGLLNDIRKLDRQAMPKLVTRYASLAFDKGQALPDQVPYPVLQTSDAQVDDTLNSLSMQRPTHTVVGLCPGAEYGPAKRWPVEHYAAVANDVIENGGAVWLFGSKKDQEVTQAINQQCNDRCIDLAGVTMLDQAIDLMSLTETIVTNDSGLMHVACALGRKVIAIYGSSSPQYTPPLSDDAHIVSLNLECSPCFERECPLGHLDCLKKLTPDQVTYAMGEF
ncbi:MAG: lipopolysaccharide heptosyltransferase II [Gammaproteobacteria bacterium]|nr:MAG: lipopolysaccharide heptosyltransferase II [Gammaproteobacteria bacterium]